MKKLYIIILIMCPIVSYGQKAKVLNYQEIDYRLLHFGFSLGINTSNFGFTRSEKYYDQDFIFSDLTKLLPGFNVNIVSEIRLSKYLGLRCLPGLTFAEREIYYMNINNNTYKKQGFSSAYIDFPILIKYKSERVNNYRPYVLLGASARYDLSFRKIDFNGDDETQIILLKPLDGYFEIGVGNDSYLQYFKFSTELKLAVGIRNIKRDKFRSESEIENRSIESLQSFLIILAFNFE